MDEIVIYEKPTCSKCRVAVGLLDESGREFTRVRYHEERLSEGKIAELIRKMGLRPHDIVRTKEATFKELGRALSDMSEAEVIAMLAKHPELIERPILEYRERAVLGRPTENVTKFLNEIA